MRPVLFHLPDWLGGLPIPSYGVMLAVGTVAGALVFEWLCRGVVARKWAAFELTLEATLLGLLVGKLTGLLLLPPGTSLSLRVAAATGGIWYFGFLAATVYVWFRVRALGLSPFDGGDRILPGIALGHGIGRIGCFLGGCCWGRECLLPWAVTHPSRPGSGLPAGVPLHPTQLYEAAVEIALFAFLAWWLRHRRRFVGQVSLLYFALYASSRLVIETFRADWRGSLGPLSTSQVVALVMLALSGTLLLAGTRRGGLGVGTDRRP